MTTRVRSGFTLVELMVVAPVAILVIATLIALMINFVGDVLIAQQRNAAVYESRDGVDQIEQDVRLSKAVLQTTGTLPSPQGSNGATAAFTASGPLSATSALILSAYATTANPMAATPASPRTLVFTNKPANPCPTPYTSNDPLTYTIVYFISSGTLWRRTIVPSATTCGGAVAWQKNSCPSTSCASEDRRVADNVSSVTVTYHIETLTPYTDVTKTTLAASDNPTSVELTINTSKSVAGGTVTSSVSMYASRLNN